MSGIYSLSEFSKSSNSKGMLLKWNGVREGKLCIIKSGSLQRGKFSVLEPVSECIVSDLLELLGVSHAINYLDKIYVDKYKYNLTVNASINFLNEDEVLLSAKKIVRNYSGDLYDNLVSLFPQFKIDLNNMILVDFLINNIDRHLRNFGIIERYNKPVRFTPLFDHGLSLYSDVSDNDLVRDTPENWELIDEAKPFCDSHYEQLKLIDKKYLAVNKVNEEDLFSIVCKYKPYLSKYRIECIKYLLSTRLKYLKERDYL